MIFHYFLTAIRNIYKSKVFSAINIVGLALGLSCSLIIFLWVNDEWQMDKFGDNSSRIYAIYQRQYSDGKVKGLYGMPGIISEELKHEFPEVQYATGLGRNEIHTFQAGDKTIKEEGNYAGADFFKIFDYKIVAGNAASALSMPSDIAISADMASSLFGSAPNAVGKTVRFEDTTNYRVTTVYQTPKNSSSRFEYLINWYSFLDTYKMLNGWQNTGPGAFVQLKEGTKPERFESQIVHFLDKYNRRDASFRVELGIQRFNDMYLHSSFNNAGYPDEGRSRYLRLFIVIALFILTIACINFVNLATARSAKRSKEIGIRKVAGAYRSSLVWQFIGEALLTVFLAMALALIIVAFLLPLFNSITLKHITFPWGSGIFWLIILVITAITGFISGIYPAVFLSSLNPVIVLKGMLKLSRSNIGFRKGLVIFQFTLSIIFIIGTIVVSKQVNYIQTKNLGYDRDNLIYLPQEGALLKKYQLFKDRAMQLPGIASISRISDPPTNIKSSTHGIDWSGKAPDAQPTFTSAGIGYDFMNTMNIKMAQGREFSRTLATDSVGFILNEEALRLVGYKDPIGKPFTLWDTHGTIIGIVKDFNFNSLYTPVNPLVLYWDEKQEEQGGYILLKIKAGQTTVALEGLSRLYKDLNPDYPFTYQFSDAEYNKLYSSEQLVGSLANFFALLALSISCLGLLGLAIFTAEQRTKEVGIRKVLGANSRTLFWLFSKDFLILVVVALLIAAPIAWFVMNNWLNNFAYRTHLSWWMFAVAGVAAIIIALLTITFQTIKLIITNPIDSIKAE